MRHGTLFGVMAKTMVAIGILGMIGPSIASSEKRLTQRRGGGGGHFGGFSRGGGMVHARREPMRTRNFVPQTNRGFGQRPQEMVGQGRPPQDESRPGNANGRFGVRENPRVQTDRGFTRTSSGRRYDNGIQLREGRRVTATWERHYFPNGYCHFPFYRPSFISGSVCISPFGFYFGICCPFISLSACTIYPPTVAYIDVPIYNGPVCTGYAPIEGVNYLEYSDLRTREPGLLNAVDELTEAFQSGNIDSMVSLVDPNVSIAVYERGKYQYSLASNNYLDLTRDAIRNIKTRQFNITRIEQRAPEVFVASGQHNYTDASGQSRSVYVSFVFQDFGGQWTLTQVGTAPDKVQSWQVKE